MAKHREFLGYLMVLLLALLVALFVTQAPRVVSPFSIPSPEGALARIGRGAINSIAVSPDEKYLAVGTAVGVYVYDAHTFEQIWYRLTGSSVFSLGFGPDERLLTGHPLGPYILVWNMATGEQLAKLNAYPGWDSELPISSDGLLVAGQVDNGPLTVWDITTLQAVRELPPRVSPESLSPSGNLLGCSDVYHCSIYDIGTGMKRSNADVSPGNFAWLSGNLALTLRPEGWSVWNADTNQVVETLPIIGVGPFAMSPDGQLISTGQDYGRLILWNVRSGEEQIALEGHLTNVQHAIWLSDSQTIITANEAEVIAWDSATGQRLRALDGFMDAVFDLEWAPDGSKMGLGLRDGRFLLLDPETGAVERFFTTGHWLASGISFSPSGEAAVLTSGYSLNILPLTGQSTLLIWGMDEPPFAVRWSPDGERIATGDFGGLVTLWDAHTTRKLFQSRRATFPYTSMNLMNDHTDRINNIAWSPDGRFLASADASKLILWDAASLTPIHSIQTWRDFGISIRFEGKAIAWSPDGSKLVSASDQGLTFWDTVTGQLIETWSANTQPRYNAVDWSPDGQLIAVAGFDGQVAIWDAMTGERLRVLTEHQLGVTRVAWSPDGSILASGSWDGSVILWDREAIEKP